MNDEFVKKIGEGKRVSLHTLGCKLNYAETSAIAQGFRERGYSIVPFGSQTDVLLLNTCSVTENAERECRQLVRRVLRTSPQAFVAVTGCYAQLRPEEIASIEGVDAVLGAKEKFAIFEQMHDFKKSASPKLMVTSLDGPLEYHTASTASEDSRTRTFLKVQDGCDYSCSFCTIPQARGASRSATIREVTDRAAALCEEGFHEIVLTGVNVGDFGKVSAESLLELVRALEANERVTARIRISSIEPNLLKQEIIDLIASSTKFCPHFHLPLQSGSPRILRVMKRRYNRELYAARIHSIKDAMPHAAIGADVIVGFPGETDEEFEETFQFLSDLDISYLHVFTYSERPNTPAAELADAVPHAVRKRRNERLRLLSEKKKHAFYAQQMGREETVILEQPSADATQRQVRHGYTANYVRVEVEASFEPSTEVVVVRLGESIADAVRAETVEVRSSRRESSILQLPVLQ